MIFFVIYAVLRKWHLVSGYILIFEATNFFKFSFYFSVLVAYVIGMKISKNSSLAISNFKYIVLKMLIKVAFNIALVCIGWFILWGLLGISFKLLSRL